MTKLVRDNIPEILQEKGKACIMHIADDAEYSVMLRAKLQEEVAEFLADKNPEELADILEVVHDIAVHEYNGYGTIEELRKIKERERGGFYRRIIVDEMTE